MENLADRLFEHLCQQSWQIVLLVLIVAVVSRFLQHRSAHVRYLLWVLVLAKCLVPPLFSIPVAVLPGQAMAATSVPPVVVSDRVQLSPILPEETTDLVTSSASAQSLWGRWSNIKSTTWITLTWLSGSMLLGLWTLFRAIRLHRIIQANRCPLPDSVQSQVTLYSKRMHVQHVPQIWQLPQSSQPFVWGLVRGGIYLPERLVHQQDGLREVLAHEICHVLRFDAFINLLQTLAQIFFWFHPVVWWANRMLRCEREKCCDEMALVLLGDCPKQYGHAIVDTLVVEHQNAFPIPSLAVAGPVKNIEDRLKTIMEPQRHFQRRPGKVSMLIATIVALALLPTGLALTQQKQNTNPSSLPVSVDPNKPNISREWVLEGDPPAAIKTGFAIWRNRIHTHHEVHTSALDLIEQGQAYPLSDLLLLDEISKDRNDPARIQSGSLIHFLIDSYDKATRETKVKFMELYRRLSRDPKQAQANVLLFKEIYSEDLHQFEAAWEQFVTQQAWRQVLIDTCVIELNGDANDLYTWLSQHSDDPATSVCTIKDVTIGCFKNIDLVSLMELAGPKHKIIGNPQVLAFVGRPASISTIGKEYFFTNPTTNELESIRQETTIDYFVRISGEEMFVKMDYGYSDFIPHARTSDIPVVTRRTTRNEFCIDQNHGILIIFESTNGHPMVIMTRIQLDP